MRWGAVFVALMSLCAEGVAQIDPDATDNANLRATALVNAAIAQLDSALDPGGPHAGTMDPACRLHMEFTRGLFRMKLRSRQLVCGTSPGSSNATFPNSSGPGQPSTWDGGNLNNIVELRLTDKTDPCVLAAILLHEAEHVGQTTVTDPPSDPTKLGEPSPEQVARIEVLATPIGLKFIEWKTTSVNGIPPASSKNLEKLEETWEDYLQHHADILNGN